MNIRKQRKEKLKHVIRDSRYEVTMDGRYRPRRNAVYFQDYCCRSCYFDWGRGFEQRSMYKHNSAESNYDGLLKKYWKSPEYEIYDEEENV
jgi:hypothetical protein